MPGFKSFSPTCHGTQRKSYNCTNFDTCTTKILCTSGNPGCINTYRIKFILPCLRTKCIYFRSCCFWFKQGMINILSNIRRDKDTITNLWNYCIYRYCYAANRLSSIQFFNYFFCYFIN